MSQQDLDEIELVSVASDNRLDDDSLSMSNGLKATIKEIRQAKIDAKVDKSKAAKIVQRTGIHRYWTA